MTMTRKMTNSLGQSPCLVTAWLFVPCYGPGNGTFSSNISYLYYIFAEGRPVLNGVGSFIESLSPDEVYDGPQATDAFDSTPCDCNTVLYSTFAACALCQGANIDPLSTHLRIILIVFLQNRADGRRTPLTARE